MVTFDLKISVRSIGRGKLEHKKYKNKIFLSNNEWQITVCSRMTICLKFVLNSTIFFLCTICPILIFGSCQSTVEEKTVCLPLAGVGFAVGKHRWQTLQFCDQMSLPLFLLDCEMFCLIWDKIFWSTYCSVIN